MVDWIFEQGNQVVTGSHGDHDYTFAGGNPVPDNGASILVFESGTGIVGGGARVEDLTVDNPLQQVGDSPTLEVLVANTTFNDLDYTIRWYADGDVEASETKTISDRDTVFYTHEPTRSSPETVEYQANTSNIVTVTWMNVDPSTLEADPYVLSPGETTTLSISVENPGSTDQDVTIEFLDSSDTVLQTETRTISAGTTETYTLDQTETVETEETYQARVTEEATSVSGLSSTATVTWTNEGLLADWSGNLQGTTATSVGSFSGWYDYDDNAGVANHGNYRAWGTAVQILDDGSSPAIAITHHDKSGEDRDELFNAITDWTYRDGGFDQYYVQDDPPDEEGGSYSRSGMDHEFLETATDGAVIGLPAGTDIEITVSGANTDGITFWNEGADTGSTIRIVNNR